MTPAITFSVEPLSRWHDLRAFFGWRYRVEVWAFDGQEQRWRPAPFLLNDTLFCWRRRATGRQVAEDVGRAAMDYCLERHRKSDQREFAPQTYLQPSDRHWVDRHLSLD